MVSMIPFGLLAGFAGDREIRITKLDETGFGFRLCKENQMMASGNTKAGKDKTKTGPQQLFRLCFYDLEKGEYNEVKISFYDLKKETDEPSEFYEKFWVFVNQPDYKQAVQSLLRQYNRYIHLKLEEDDSGLAKNMTGYPGELDQVRCESLEAQMQIWDEEVQAVVSEATSDGKEIWKKLNAELALELDHTEMYADYLRLSFAEFLKKYAENSIGICKKLLQSERKPKWLYIGNQFCHLLFPEQDMLFKLMEKAIKEHLKITLVFSYIREYKLDFISRLLCEIDKWCRLHNCQIEVVINEWETCGYTQLFPIGKNSLHIPFYQTNTSQYCPLFAVCANGERGRQKLMKNCPEYCREYVLLYPEHLHMMGRYNSLFGIDMDALKDIKVLEAYIKNGVDRLVIGEQK